MKIGEIKTLRTFYRYTVGVKQFRKNEFKIKRVTDKHYHWASSSNGRFKFSSGYDADEDNYWDAMDAFKSWEKKQKTKIWHRTQEDAKKLPFPPSNNLKLEKLSKTKPQVNNNLAAIPSNGGVRCFISKNWIIGEDNKFLAPCFSGITKSFQEIFRKFPGLLLEAELVSFADKCPFAQLNKTKETNIKLYERVKREFHVNLIDVVSTENFFARRDLLDEIRSWSNSKIFHVSRWDSLHFASQAFIFHESNLPMGCIRTFVKPIESGWGDNFYIENKKSKVVDVVNTFTKDKKIYKIIINFPGYGMIDIFPSKNIKPGDYNSCKIEYFGLLDSGAPASPRFVSIK